MWYSTPAIPSGVSASCPTSLHVLLLWTKFRAVFSFLRRYQLLLNILARRSAIASLSVGAVANCNVALLVGHALARTRLFFLFPSRLFSCARAQHAPSHQFLRAVCWWRAIAPHSQWLEAVSEKDAILFNFAVGGAGGGVLVRDSLLSSAWILAGNVVSAKQFRSLPERLRSDNR